MRGETILQVVEAAVQGIVRDLQVEPLGCGRKQKRQFRILLQVASKLGRVQRSHCHRVRGMDPIPGERLPDRQNIAHHWREGHQHGVRLRDRGWGHGKRIPHETP